MRVTRFVPAAAVLAALLAGACSKDATGPSIALSLEEVGTLAQELGGVLSAMNVNPPLVREHGSPLLGALARAARAGTPVSGTTACLLGGTGSVTGTFDTTTTQWSANATVTYSGCKTAHYTTSGSVQLVADYGAATDSLHATANGTLSVAALDGRTGSCAIQLTGAAAATTGPAPTYVGTGYACGLKVGTP